MTHDKLVTRLAEHREPVRAMHFSQNGNRLLPLSHGRVQSFGEAPILWSADDGRLDQRLQSCQGLVVAAAFTQDGKNALTASSEGHLRLFAADAASLRTEGKLPRNSRSMRTVALSTNGDIAATGSEDGRLYQGAVDRLEVLLGARLASQSVLDLRFDPHSQTLAASLEYRSILRYACLLCAPVDKLMAVAAARLDGSQRGRQVMGTRP
jgi:WD40 repeat protein